MEVPSKETLKSPIKRNCLSRPSPFKFFKGWLHKFYLVPYMSRCIHQWKNVRNQDSVKWSFCIGYIIHLRTNSFLKMISKDIVSVYFQDNWRDRIYSRMYIRSPLPLLFRSNLNEALNPLISNWAERNESSSFVSE